MRSWRMSPGNTKEKAGSAHGKETTEICAVRSGAVAGGEERGVYNPRVLSNPPGEAVEEDVVFRSGGM